MRLTTKARDLRVTMTESEQKVWEAVRNRKTGFKIVWQKPLILRKDGEEVHYFADFYCNEKHAIIEIDGSSHDVRENQDARRDELTKAAGYQVIRFSVQEILEAEEWKQKLTSFLNSSPLYTITRSKQKEMSPLS